MASTTIAVAGTALQTFLEYARLVISWKALAILLIVVNIKNAPLAWHARVFYYMFSRTNFTKHNLTTKTRSRVINSSSSSRTISSHPIFAPSSMLSHTPLTEMDYNLHKSNSTYFSDLDVSRTALVTDIYTPGVELIRRELDQKLVDDDGDGDDTAAVAAGKSEKKKKKKKRKKKLYPGGIFVVLGSVYCSFKKPIIAYERYEMQSRIVGWDEKWLYVVTYFLRPEKRHGHGQEQEQGQGEKKKKDRKELLAVGISEYVTKKGRYTISPAKILAASGLLPEPQPSPDATTTTTTITNADGLCSSADDTPPAGGKIDIPDAKNVKQEVLEEQKAKNQEFVELDPEWNWENIEKERVRGMELVKHFVGLERGLVNELGL